MLETICNIAIRITVTTIIYSCLRSTFCSVQLKCNKSGSFSRKSAISSEQKVATTYCNTLAQIRLEAAATMIHRLFVQVARALISRDVDKCFQSASAGSSFRCCNASAPIKPAGGQMQERPRRGNQIALNLFLISALNLLALSARCGVAAEKLPHGGCRCSFRATPFLNALRTVRSRRERSQTEFKVLQMDFVIRLQVD